MMLKRRGSFKINGLQPPEGKDTVSLYFEKPAKELIC
jgi:hypothetical protein